MQGQRVRRKLTKPPEERPSADELSVADYLRKQLPCKKTKFMARSVEYFAAARAVDALLDSPWASGANGTPVLFTDRQSVVDFMDIMLRHKFFHRCKKVAITDRDLRRKQLLKLKKKEKREAEKVSKDIDEGKAAKEEESGSECGEGKVEKSNAEDTGPEKSGVEAEDAAPTRQSAKPKRRVRLDMHLEQVFVDGSDAYVWLYDPIPKHYWIVGLLVVAAIIAICLFPLWPSRMREYVYYFSLAAAAFLALILALAVLRVIVFVLLWGVTWGRHRLWLLPNLTEDVGFFASFWPLYHYEYRCPSAQPKKEKRVKNVKVTYQEDNEMVEESVGPETEKDSAAEQAMQESDAATAQRPATHQGSVSEGSA